MAEQLVSYTTYIVLGGVGLYTVARIVTAAYFKSKLESELNLGRMPKSM